MHDTATSSVAIPEPVTLSDATEEPYLLWGFTFADRPYAGSGDQAQLLDLARDVASAWSPDVDQVVSGAQPDSVAAYRYYSADPGTPMAPWQAGPITAIGDAVHPMPPTGGRGAATAIRDAGALTDALTRVVRAEITPVVAVRHFQLEMIDYAAVAVRESLGPLRAQRYLRGPVLRVLTLAGAVRVPERRPRHPYERLFEER